MMYCQMLLGYEVDPVFYSYNYCLTQFYSISLVHFY